MAGTTSNYAYTYDPMGRLLTVTKDGSLVEQYQYGANGARVSEMNALRGISSRTMAYTEEDHMYQTGDTTYQYDVDGFLMSKTKGTEKTEYAYSSRGELLQAKLPDGRVIDYYHDPLGRRIAKAVNGVITEKYLWQNLIRLLAVYDGNDNLLMRFDYADGRMPVAMTSAGNTYYLTYDQVGSLRVISDVSGNVVKQIEYDAFGNIINATNPSFTIPFGFAGDFYDQDTGLVRFGLRDYDPDIARWTSKDPIGFKAGYTDLYSYCLNNPINFIDPLGLNSWRYDLSDEILYYLDDDGNALDSWIAVSGPWGAGALPAGSYTLPGGPCALPESQRPYCDPSGNCWWQAIEPDFETDRDGFGIHPDGNVEGTEGCVGAIAADRGNMGVRP